MKVVVVVCAIVMTIAVLFIARQVTLGMHDKIEQRKEEKATEKRFKEFIEKNRKELEREEAAKEAERKAAAEAEAKRMKEQQEAERKAAEERKAQLTQMLTEIGIQDPQIEKSCLNILVAVDKVNDTSVFNLEYAVAFDRLKNMGEVMSAYVAIDSRKDRIIRWRSTKIVDGGFLYVVYVKPKEVE